MKLKSLVTQTNHFNLIFILNAGVNYAKIGAFMVEKAYDMQK